MSSGFEDLTRQIRENAVKREKLTALLKSIRNDWEERTGMRFSSIATDKSFKMMAETYGIKLTLTDQGYIDPVDWKIVDEGKYLMTLLRLT